MFYLWQNAKKNVQKKLQKAGERMAKKVKSLSFTNATISIADNTITEYTKDDTIEYNLMNVLKEWSEIDGLSISFKQNNDVSTRDYEDKESFEPIEFEEDESMDETEEGL